MAARTHTIFAFAFASAIAATAPALAEKPSLETQFETVCASAFVKSENLQAACAARAMPEPLKDGSRFKAVGIGAELNALAANLHLISGR